MPTFIFWGDDDYLIERNLQKLRTEVVSTDWESCNFSQYAADGDVQQALDEVLTPPLGQGGRLVVLPCASLLGASKQVILPKLEFTLSQLLETNTLLLTSPKKLDGRLKVTRLLLQKAQVREFSLISPWNRQAITERIEAAAQFLEVSLTPDAVNLLRERVGTNTRVLFSELEKLQNFADGQELDAQTIDPLICSTTASSPILAQALLHQDGTQALAQLQKLLIAQEPISKIIATLTTFFRQWLWVKLLTQQGETDSQVVATQAGIHNPKRLYYLRQEVATVSARQLLQVLQTLLELDLQIKSGMTPQPQLIAAICQLCQT